MQPKTTGWALAFDSTLIRQGVRFARIQPNAPKGSVFRITLPRLAQMTAPALSGRRGGI
jgi:hypothetical protein